MALSSFSFSLEREAAFAFLRFFEIASGPCHVLDWTQLTSLSCSREYAMIVSNALAISNFKEKASTADGQPLRTASRRRRRRRHGDDTDKHSAKTPSHRISFPPRSHITKTVSLRGTAVAARPVAATVTARPAALVVR